jgi:hypothetical protein
VTSSRSPTRASIASEQFHAPIGRVWTAIQRAYTALEIPVTSLDPATFLVVTKNQRMRAIGGRPLGRYIDCPQMYDNVVGSGTVAVTMTTQLVPTASDSVTEIRTEVSASGYSTVAGTTVVCSSNGRLQTLLQKTVAQQLDSTAA